MKRVLCFIAVLVLFVSSSFAEGIDFSSMTIEELEEVIKQAREELDKKRSELKKQKDELAVDVPVVSFVNDIFTFLSDIHWYDSRADFLIKLKKQGIGGSSISKIDFSEKAMVYPDIAFFKEAWGYNIEADKISFDLEGEEITLLEVVGTKKHGLCTATFKMWAFDDETAESLAAQLIDQFGEYNGQFVVAADDWAERENASEGMEIFRSSMLDGFGCQSVMVSIIKWNEIIHGKKSKYLVEIEFDSPDWDDIYTSLLN